MLEYASGVHQEANEQTQRLHKYFDVLFHYTIIIFYHTMKLLGVYWFHFVRRSVRLSVHLSCIPCPLCSTYSSGWIHFIYIHLIKQFLKVCRVSNFSKTFKIWIFWQFFKFCNLLDFVLFWLGIWCQSLVWVIMGRVFQNAGVLVVLVLFCFEYKSACIILYMGSLKCKISNIFHFRDLLNVYFLAPYHSDIIWQFILSAAFN